MQAGTIVAASLALATTIAAIGITTKARADIRITHDMGGRVDTYANRVNAARWSGERVVIDGPCYSACTMWLTLPAGQVCATGRAVFGFHSATNELGIPDWKTNDTLMKALPPKVRLHIGKRGGLWLNVITVRGTQIAARCR